MSDHQIATTTDEVEEMAREIKESEVGTSEPWGDVSPERRGHYLDTANRVIQALDALRARVDGDRPGVLPIKDRPSLFSIDEDDLVTSKWLLKKIGEQEAMFTAPYGVKMFRQTLCIVEGLLYRDHHFNDEDASESSHVRTVKALIEQCDAHRPLGSNGKHGTLHTPTCGCDR